MNDQTEPAYAPQNVSLDMASGRVHSLIAGAHAMADHPAQAMTDLIGAAAYFAARLGVADDQIVEMLTSTTAALRETLDDAPAPATAEVREAVMSTVRAGMN